MGELQASVTRGALARLHQQLFLLKQQNVDGPVRCVTTSECVRVCVRAVVGVSGDVDQGTKLWNTARMMSGERRGNYTVQINYEGWFAQGG